MPRTPPKRRLLSMLRRTAKSAQVATIRNVAEESGLWTAHERALTSTKDASGAAQRIAAGITRQRGAVEAIADRMRALAVRAQELSTSLTRIGDAFDRLGLIALNTGLEGARLGESAGRALLLVSDEVRSQSSRGGEAARDVTQSLAEVARELVQLTANVTEARDATGELTQEAARVASSSAEAEAALVEVGERLRRASGSDPETARAIALAADHARAFVASLQELTGRVPRPLLLGALRPVLDPLARLLAEDEPLGDDEAGG